jgi:choline dehydrogenase-like flavoprotein
MANETHYDVIIIGSGAGGGTLAYALAPTGKRILILERGDYVPRERDNWDTRAVVTNGKYNNAEPWCDRDGKEFHAGARYFVGGNVTTQVRTGGDGAGPHEIYLLDSTVGCPSHDDA